MIDIKKFLKGNIFFISAILILVLMVYDQFQSKQSTTHYKSTSQFSADCKRDYKEVFINEVCDGDTVSLTTCGNDQKENKIRLIGIDAFEMGQNEYAAQAKQYLNRMVSSKNVCIELDAEEHDVYGRTLGYVFLKANKNGRSRDRSNIGLGRDGGSRGSGRVNLIFVNEDLIKKGYALYFSVEPNTKYAADLKRAQAYARRGQEGTWRDRDTIKETPAEYRARSRRN